MEKYTTITVEREIQKDLMHLKIDMSAKSLNEVIKLAIIKLKGYLRMNKKEKVEK